MRSEAQKKADSNYRNRHKGAYKILSCNVKKEDAELIKEKCEYMGITVNKLLSEFLLNFLYEECMK